MIAARNLAFRENAFLHGDFFRLRSLACRHLLSEAMPVSGSEGDSFFRLTRLSLEIGVAAFEPSAEGMGWDVWPELSGFSLGPCSSLPNGAPAAGKVAAGAGTVAGGDAAEGIDFAAKRTFCSSRVWLIRMMASTSADGIFSLRPIMFPSPAGVAADLIFVFGQKLPCAAPRFTATAFSVSKDFVSLIG